MAYVPGVTYDLFISYAHADDDAGKDDERWVSALVGDLIRATKKRLGLETDQELAVFFDRGSLHSNDELEILKDHARNSAVFIAIVSPSYVKREWTRNELNAFAADPQSAGRIIAIESLPANQPGDYPPTLRQRKRTEFWERRQHSENEYTLTRDDRQWHDKIQDVAADIRRVLLRLHEGRGVRATVAPPRPPASNRTVLLAQVTDDLDEDREQVRRYLEQYGISVLPHASFPQGGADFSQAFEADLAGANLFVQLLSKVKSRRPPDLPAGYALYQYETARREAEKRPKFGCMLWRRPDLDPASVTHEDAPLLAMPDTLAMGLEAFKAEILKWIERANEPEKPKPEREHGINVFVNASREDAELANAIQKEFERNGCTTVLPLHDGSPSVIMDDLRERIIWCDALALIYGQADARWVSRQAMLYSKLKRERDEPARIVMICRGPPQPKQEHGVWMPELREVDYGEGVSDDPIARLLSELRQ